MPEISVIMSTYNEKIDYLRQAIESVQNQTFTNFEFIIILDNPENDAIRNCVYKYAEEDQRIKVIENENNLGLTQSLNKAIRIASGIYMSRMDADDIMHKNCLECELKVIQKFNLDFVSASKINIDERGNRLGKYINDFSPKQMRKLLPYDNSVNHSTVMVRLDKVRKENDTEKYHLAKIMIYGCGCYFMDAICVFCQMYFYYIVCMRIVYVGKMLINYINQSASC